MGYSDWNDESKQFEGLRYLYDYDVHKATEMMTSPKYTRAFFVRDPKKRIVSNFLEYVIKDDGKFLSENCCAGRETCKKRGMRFSKFLNVINTCDEPFWRPQGRKMEPKYYAKLNFIGHYDSMKEDAQKLLKQLGLWEEYGASGWGSDSNSPIFDSVREITESEFYKAYTTPEIEKKAQKYFRSDYDNKLLGLKRRVRFGGNSTTSADMAMS